MQDVLQIKAAYDWMIRVYDERVQIAVVSNDQRAIEQLDATREWLERGVFVLLFAQFEVKINNRFEKQRDRRKSNPDWRQRRGWDLDALQAKHPGRVPFHTRLGLTMDRNGANYGRVLEAYDRRNHCAHGGSTQPVGSIDQLVSDLYMWQADLD